MAHTRGFTLIEMMAVILILGLVTSLVAVNVMDRVEWAKVQTTRVKMRAVEGALEMFQLEKAAYPETDPGLVALLEPGTGGRAFVRDEEALEDSWKRRFGYEQPGTQHAQGYDLWSNGRDGNPGGEGPDADLTNWERSGAARAR
jgi:general secretion pathway protein G